MLRRLTRLLGADGPEVPGITPSEAGEPAPREVSIGEAPSFPLARHLTLHRGFPILDWKAVDAWVGSHGNDAWQSEAWAACQRAWLLHFRDALGTDFRLVDSPFSIVVASLDERGLRRALSTIDRSLRKILGLLDGVAELRSHGKNVLIVFDDDQRYYEYVSHYYPESGEFAFSGGMHIHAGHSHLVTRKREIHYTERTIAHEMTHACLAHLPLPSWLDEGLAVNTEIPLVGARALPFPPRELRAKHHAFWGEPEIQEFWTGRSFHRPDDGQALSYDLARIMVSQLAQDWPRFQSFVLAAQRDDAGYAAATEHLGIDLGEYVCFLLEQAACPGWAPRSPGDGAVGSP